MAYPPKAPGQRRRSNTGQQQWRKLHVDDGVAEIPPYPASIVDSPAACEWWQTVWADPMAVLYLPADHLALARGAQIYGWTQEGKPRRQKDGSIIIGNVGTADVSELRQIEDRFGLSPRARRLLMWEVSQVRAVNENDAPVARPAGKERKLRAVDVNA